MMNVVCWVANDECGLLSGKWWMWFVVSYRLGRITMKTKWPLGHSREFWRAWHGKRPRNYRLVSQRNTPPPSFLNMQSNHSVRIDIIRIFQMHGFNGFNKKLIMISCLRLLLMFDHTVSSFLKISFDCRMMLYMQQWLGKVNEEYKIGEN